MPLHHGSSAKNARSRIAATDPISSTTAQRYKKNYKIQITKCQEEILTYATRAKRLVFLRPISRTIRVASLGCTQSQRVCTNARMRTLRRVYLLPFYNKSPEAPPVERLSPPPKRKRDCLTLLDRPLIKLSYYYKLQQCSRANKLLCISLALWSCKCNSNRGGCA